MKKVTKFNKNLNLHIIYYKKNIYLSAMIVSRSKDFGSHDIDEMIMFENRREFLYVSYLFRLIDLNEF